MIQKQTLVVQVTAIEQVTPVVKRFVLMRRDGGRLPPFSGGSHVIVSMSTAERWHRNPYSLMSSPVDLDRYEIGVRRLDDSRGGSHHLHDTVRPGDVLEITHPVNLFPLQKLARKHVLVAGGIGVTPMLAQLADLRVGDVPFELHYAARSRAWAPFVELLEDEYSPHVQFYFRDNGRRIAFGQLLDKQPLGTHLYVCGPASMIAEAMQTASALGWPGSHLHSEQFGSPPIGDAFTAVLARSGQAITVAPERSLLESIEAAGVRAPYLCRGGVCGECLTKIIEADGRIVHHDHFLTDEEKAAGQLIMPCVSRFQGGKLVLDL